MRLNVWGSAGAGKSTTAGRLFGDLKMAGFQVDYVSEYIKDWAYLDRRPSKWDQLYVFGKQMNREEVKLKKGVNIVSDSPLLMNAAYGKHFEFPGADELISLAVKYEKDHPSANVFLRRHHSYEQDGRFYTEDEDRQIEDTIIGVLRENVTGFLFDPPNYESILAWAKQALTESK